MNRVIVIGAHGRTGSAVVAQLTAAGHHVTGTVRRPAHQDALHAAGADAVVVDLMTTTSDELTTLLTGVDTVVYAAGSGWGAPKHVVDRLDRDAIIAMAEAAVAARVRRFLLVSAHRADEDRGDPVVDTLLRAKRIADSYVRSTPLDWTIVRPDALTTAAPTGQIRAATHVPPGALPCADLAALIETALRTPATSRRQFEVTGGSTPITVALETL